MTSIRRKVFIKILRAYAHMPENCDLFHRFLIGSLAFKWQNLWTKSTIVKFLLSLRFDDHEPWSQGGVCLCGIFCFVGSVFLQEKEEWKIFMCNYHCVLNFFYFRLNYFWCYHSQTLSAFFFDLIVHDVLNLIPNNFLLLWYEYCNNKSGPKMLFREFICVALIFAILSILIQAIIGLLNFF